MMTLLHAMNDAVSDLIYVTYIFFSKLPIYIKEASTCEFFQKNKRLRNIKYHYYYCHSCHTFKLPIQKY